MHQKYLNKTLKHEDLGIEIVSSLKFYLNVTWILKSHLDILTVYLPKTLASQNHFPQPNANIHFPQPKS